MKKIIVLSILISIILLSIGMYFFRGYFGFETDTIQVEQTASDQTSIEEQKEAVYPDWYEKDKDGDGIEDSVEQEQGTDLYSSDTDGDGLSDKVEIEKYHTDPSNPDTDGDGYWDAIEILNGYNPNGEGTL